MRALILTIAANAMLAGAAWGQSIEGPASVPAGADFEVTVDGPSDQSEIIAWATPGADARLPRHSYGYVSRANNGKLSMEAPEEPGSYELLYMSGKSVLARQAIEVTPVSAVLTATATVKAGAMLEGTWQGPNHRGDYIGIAERDANDRVAGAPYAYVGNTKNHRFAIRAPETPGEFDVVYLTRGSRVLARAPFEIVPVTASVEGPAEALAGGTIEVRWQGESHQGDYVSLASRGGERLSGASYGYTRNSPDNLITLKLPEEPGEYDIVYVTPGGAILARAPLTIAGVTASVEGPSEVIAGGTVEVRWDGVNNQGDYVSLASRGGERLSGANYGYTRNSPDNLITLKLPEEPGEYDIVYVTPGGAILARAPLTITDVTASVEVSAPVFSGSEFVVSWSGPDNDGDWITIAARDGERVQGATYAYTRNAVDGKLRLTALEELGPYDVIYVTPGGRALARTPIDIIDVTASLTAQDEVEALTVFPVTWDGPGNRGDRVVVVDAASGDDVHYGNVDQNDDVVLLRAPEQAGEYRLVYRTPKGRELASIDLRVSPAPQKPGWVRVRSAASSGLSSSSAVEIILDASGSMLQRQDGERRIAIATRTISGLVSDTIPEGTGFALRVFGHKEADSCRTDLEIPLQPLQRASALSTLGGVQAMNLAKTPIAASLAAVANDLSGATGEKIVILVTDGEETCEGDPALVIESLCAKGWDIRVNIVGFAIDDRALRDEFETWATLGGGTYFDAADAGQLADGLTRAVARPFDIVDGTGTRVAGGLATDEPILLPAGEYRLRYSADGAEQTIAFVIKSDTTTPVDLP